MKRIISLFAVLALVLSLVPAAFAEDGYIPAPYDPAVVDPTVTYLEPVFYENETGPTIGVTTVGVIVKDGLYFKDLNNNKELDPSEDWRLDAKTRATDLVSKMELVDQAGIECSAVNGINGHDCDAKDGTDVLTQRLGVGHICHGDRLASGSDQMADLSAGGVNLHFNFPVIGFSGINLKFAFRGGSAFPGKRHFLRVTLP